jgi:hypothetical protein
MGDNEQPHLIIVPATPALCAIVEARSGALRVAAAFIVETNGKTKPIGGKCRRGKCRE